MANLIQGKPRRRLQKARRAIDRMLNRDAVASAPKKTKAVTTKALMIPSNDSINFDRLHVLKQRFENCLAMQN